ncbi:CU044_5270 family protein [Nonomuraea sp. NPDC026600]|uniref:CU044_5270 family protein n=1 Tax=Nonomuraea sp. NPDC026600 TaxID=3155363 RepID=UPI0033DEEDB4
MKKFQLDDEAVSALIDDVMPDVRPADPARVMAVRARVLSGPPRRRLPGWSGVALAAASVALVLVGGFVVVPRLGRGEVDTATTSNVPAVLGAAADRLAAQPEGTGAWWRREMLRVERRIATSENPTYLIERRGSKVLWVNRAGEERTENGDVTAVPFSPADKRAWKEAGSPPLCDPGGGCTISKIFFTSVDTKTLKPVAQLPTDADALKAELLKRRYPANGIDSQESWLWEAGSWLLLDAPSTQGTRAAVYRMLAGLPGVRVVDGAKDDEGRAGVALMFGDSRRQEIVIDRESGDLLAVQSRLTWRKEGLLPILPVGPPFEAFLLKRLGWTDEVPKS